MSPTNPLDLTMENKDDGNVDVLDEAPEADVVHVNPTPKTVPKEDRLEEVFGERLMRWITEQTETQRLLTQCKYIFT